MGLQEEAVRGIFTDLDALDILSDLEKAVIRTAYAIDGFKVLKTREAASILNIPGMKCYQHERSALKKIILVHLQRESPEKVDAYARKVLPGFILTNKKRNLAQEEADRTERNMEMVQARRHRFPAADIAVKYGVSTTTVYNAVNRCTSMTLSEYQCEDCETRFQFKGELLDATCPDCKSIHVRIV